MKTKHIVLIGVAAFMLMIITFAVGIFIHSINVKAERNVLYQEFEAMKNSQEIAHDARWQTIAQIAQVDVANDTLQRAVISAWENALSKTGSMGASGSVIPILVQQAGISVDTKLKEKLTQAIDDLTFEFTKARENLSAACKRYNTFVQDPWNQMFLPATMEDVEDCQIITSTRTKTARETGVDDNVKVYQN